MNKTEIEYLRNILDNLQNPTVLDMHPWTARPFVMDAIEKNALLQSLSPGEQLVHALTDLFATTIPAVPPRRGKRLDSHWGAFGMLASHYFYPLRQGYPAPISLRDAWGRIDESILLYVSCRDVEPLTPAAINKYKLVGDEPAVTPGSTLSDWHRKGMQSLLEAVNTRDRYLAGQSNHVETSTGVELATARRRRSVGRIVLWSLCMLLLALTSWGVYKANRIYKLALIVEEDAVQIRKIAASSPDLEMVASLSPELDTLRRDFDLFKAEVESVLWLTNGLEWLPAYGRDIASSEELLTLADRLLESGELTLDATQPLLTVLERGERLDPPQLVEILRDAQPRLSDANDALEQAMQIRAGLDADQLSPRLQSLIEDDLDRLIPVMQQGLTVALALPDFLGATTNGPKTYLLLVQNEDELRPTGGFITAAGTLVIQDGHVLDVTFIDSGELDNWDHPYPISPWQLDEYMNSPVLVLRDSNWFVDFPTSALYAETLFAYNYSHSVNGVIAFDQYMLVLILQALGQIELSGTGEVVDAGNVINYMRSAKSPPAGTPRPEGWTRKGFMKEITEAILFSILQEQNVSWRELGSALLQGLDQHHLLLQLDDGHLSTLIAARRWNGDVTAGEGDYLRVVDTNVGFNKTSALVDTSLVYDVDLTDTSKPVAHLTVVHKNKSSADVECIHWGGEREPGEDEYPINACYWNYMRVYKPLGTSLLDAVPQAIPKEWILLDRGGRSQVDILDDDIEGLQAFGTMMVVPGSDTILTEFEFGLPEDILVISPDTSHVSYSLKVDKQPGTIAIPLTLRIHLPNGSVLVTTPQGTMVDGNNLLFETDLRLDLNLEVSYQLK